jgi:beta-amylase
VISEIEIGAGPCGELRYPSYQQTTGWSYPGCGLFQTYDSQFVSILEKAASEAGHPDWGVNPSDTGDQNVHPGGSAFWTDGWSSTYGKFYIKWYWNQLILHGRLVTKAAREAFGNDVRLSAKVAGIHWWYTNACHCAETTAGFLNYADVDGYRDILQMFKENNIDLCFTCLEMTPNSGAGSDPPALVQQLADDASWAGLKFEGENALECYDSTSYGRIVAWVSKGLSTFTYLRLGDTLMQDGNFATFKQFVSDMHNA